MLSYSYSFVNSSVSCLMLYFVIIRLRCWLSDCCGLTLLNI